MDKPSDWDPLEEELKARSRSGIMMCPRGACPGSGMLLHIKGRVWRFVCISCGTLFSVIRKFKSLSW